MIRPCRSRILTALAALLSLAAAAWAEGIFTVNTTGAGPGPWVFDQPSVTPNGTVLHVAFVGDNAVGGGTPSTRVYYAAVNGAADFTNKATIPSQVILTAPVAIDNALFTNARHPQVALRSTTEVAILFQAIPSDDLAAGFKLFLALLTIDNNAVTAQSVAEILGASGARMPGRLTDPTFALVAADNSLRVAFSSFPSLAAPSPYADVYYARVGVDNAMVVDNTLTLLTKTAASTGISALPRLRLEGTTRGHIAWAADTGTTAPSDIYYAMVKEGSPGVDNLAIGATPVLGNQRWGYPTVLLPAASRVLVVAGVETGIDGIAGPLGVAYLNPDAVTHDGNPVTVENLIAGASFIVSPPDNRNPLSNTFSAYHPEASLDVSNRVHVAGYGSFDGTRGTAGTYFSMSLQGVTPTKTTTGNIADLVSPGVPVGSGNLAFADSIPGDYTRPAFVHFTGKAVLFWSGQDNVVADSRNLYVTSALSSTDIPVAAKQSGCSMVDDPRGGEAGRIPGAAVLLLPAALLALRKGIRKAIAR
jgi:hypothetical protein